MKQIIPIFIMLLMASLVMAQTVPTPVIGVLSLNGQNPTGYKIKVTNLDNPDANVIQGVSSLTTENGKFVFDLSYFGRFSDGSPQYTGPSPHYPGDRLKVEVYQDALGNPYTCVQCSLTFNVPRSFPTQIGITAIDSAPVVQPAPQSGSSSGGGSGGGGGSGVNWVCGEWTSCISGTQVRKCTQNSITTTEAQSCTIVTPTPTIEPTPVQPVTPESIVTPTPEIIPTPVIPTPIAKLKCDDGTEVSDLKDCPSPSSNLEAYLIGLIAFIIGVFAWGKGFAALIKSKLKKADEAEKMGNKALAKKYRDTAEKMAKSVITNFMAGKYKK